MRWNEDTRGTGIATGEAALPEVDRFRQALVASGWVAEDPESHLLPHIQRAIERDAPEWRVIEAAAIDAVLVVTLQSLSPGNLADLRAAVFTLIGSFAESATFVRQTFHGRDVIFDIATGMLDGDSPFAAHGHLVRFVILEAHSPA
jgi:hypothetical protein